MANRIDHNGVVESIENNHIRVRIVQTSACAACQAKAMCASAEAKEKVVDVYDDDARRYKVGDEVVVCGSLTMGRNAVTLAFTIPLVLTVVSVFVALKVVDAGELTAIGAAVVVLAIYYSVLAAMQKRLARTFAFWIEQRR